MLDMHRAVEADLPRLEEIMNEAFPPAERMPFKFLVRRAKGRQPRADFWAFTDESAGQEPVGFAYCFIPAGGEDPAYIYYFAFAAEAQGKGYGSAAIPMLAAHYAGHPLLLCLEPQDEAAENAVQRTRRHAFYLRAGFTDMPFGVIEVGIPYDVMCLGGTATPKDYRGVFARYLGWPGRLFYPIVIT